MTVEEMERLGDIALRIAQSSLERGQWSPVTVLHFPGGRIEEFHIPHECLVMMDSFVAKEAIYRIIRVMHEQKGADATVFGQDILIGRPTALGLEAPRHLIERLLDERNFQTGVDLGLLERHEAVTALVQTETYVVQLIQHYRRTEGRIAYYGDRETLVSFQSQFDGALKMFGALFPIRPAAEALMKSVLESWFRNKWSENDTVP